VVTVGRRTEESAEILGGLAEVERVIVYPSDALEDGSRVTPVG